MGISHFINRKREEGQDTPNILEFEVKTEQRQEAQSELVIGNELRRK